MVTTITLAWPTFNVDLPTVTAWMKANAGSSFAGISANTVCQIHFTSDPGSTIAGEIQSYWAGLTSSSPEATNYTANQALAVNQAKIAAAVAFGNKLLTQFAAENLGLGIEAANMVDEVLTIVAPVLVALQTGSLTSAISRIKAIPTGSYDSTFVTAARLLSYCNQIETFLGITLSTSV